MSEEVTLAGVIGDPIGHSRSPIVHGHWLKRHGLKGFYVPLHVSRENFADVLRVLPKMGFRGVNVTVPHKELAINLADSVTDRAALIGAANTLTFTKDGKVQADNTDGVGFLRNLKQVAPGWSASDGPCLVLGGGGAARAVVAALLEDGAPKVIIMNRTKARVEAIRDHFGAKVEVQDWTQIPEIIGSVATLVNTTTLGMVGGYPLSINLDNLKSKTLVTDVVYTPLRTDLLVKAEAQGCRVVDGLGMLLHQAVPGFERWFGPTPVVDEELRQAVLNT
jgi:shikimate dehydrogenase